MKNNRLKNKLLIIPIIAILCSTSFFMIYDAETSDAAPPKITLTAGDSYVPKFTVSPWKVNEYNSISYVYTTTVSGDFTNSWWVGQIPGITISAYGGSAHGNGIINAVNNGNGTYSYYFKLSGTPTTTGIFDANNQFFPVFPVLAGMNFKFTIYDPSVSKYHSNSVQDGIWYHVYATEAIEFGDAEWSSYDKTWDFPCKIVGVGHAEGYFGAIRFASIQVKATNNTSNISFDVNSNPQYLGSYPASSTGIDYSGAFSVANLAISAIISIAGTPMVGVLWAAISFVAALGFFTVGHISQFGYESRNWYWNPDIQDTGQYFKFDVKVEPNQTVGFSYEYYLLGPRYEGLTVGKNYWTLHAGPPGKSGLSMNPEQMTILEREQCGIETILRENLSARAAELNISETTLKEWLESDEDEFYYAHDFVSYETPQPEKIELNRSTLTKDLLMYNLSEQIEWSEKIISGFSTEGICDMEDGTEIVQKHKARLASLQELQKQLEAAQKTDSVRLNIIFDSYCNIMGIDSNSSKTT